MASLRLALSPAYLAPVAVQEGVGGGGFVREGVAEVLGSVGMVSADRCSVVLRLAAIVPAYLAPVAVQEDVGGGGFVREGVVEVLGGVDMVSAADRCSVVLRLAALAPAYLAPVAVQEGVGGGGFVREGVVGAIGDVGVISAADRCSAVLHWPACRWWLCWLPSGKGGGAQTAVGIKMHIVPYLRRDKPVRRQGCTHLIVLMKYRGL